MQLDQLVYLQRRQFHYFHEAVITFEKTIMLEFRDKRRKLVCLTTIYRVVVSVALKSWLAVNTPVGVLVWIVLYVELYQYFASTIYTFKANIETNKSFLFFIELA